MTFCQSKGDIPYFETSAKEAVNIDQAFEGGLCAAPRPEAPVPLMSPLPSHCTQRPGTGRV